MEIIKSSHSVYQLQYHVVWVCKYRRRILNPGICGYLRKVLPKLLRSMPGVTIESIGFDQDHLHMVMTIPPKYSIAQVMGRLKSQSASHMRKTFAWLKKVYWKESVVWSPGYFVSSVGVDEQTIKNYVEHQGRQDSGQLRLQL
jgi:putative transposase